MSDPIKKIGVETEFILSAKPNGQYEVDGEPIYDSVYDMKGHEDLIFQMMCEVIDKNPVAERLFRLAIKYKDEHDTTTCPWCIMDANKTSIS